MNKRMPKILDHQAAANIGVTLTARRIRILKDIEMSVVVDAGAAIDWKKCEN